MSSNQVRILVGTLVVVMVTALFVVRWLASRSEPAQPLQAPLPMAQLEPNMPAPLPEPKAKAIPSTDKVEPVVTESQPAPKQPAKPAQPKLFDFVLPKLDESDSTIFAQLKAKLAHESLNLLVDEGVIERFVVTADAIAQGKVPYNLLPVGRPSGSYKVIEAHHRLYSSTANIARYQPYLDLMAAMPRDYWLAFYEHIYPLLQQSYERLGYPEQQFHPTLLQAIERLLDTVKPSASMELIQPNVMYEYAEPGLQQGTSPVEKLMLRLGPDVNSKLKEWLKGIEQGLKQKQF